MIFSGLKEIAQIFHDNLSKFARSEDGVVEIDGYEMMAQELDQKYVDYSDDEKEVPILKLSYMGDVDGEVRECVLAFISPEGMVVQTPDDLEMFTYAEILGNGLFMLSMNDLAKFNHIYKVMVN